MKTAWLKELLPMHTRSGHQDSRKNRGESNIGPGKGKWGDFSNCETENPALVENQNEDFNFN